MIQKLNNSWYFNNRKCTKKIFVQWRRIVLHSGSVPHHRYTSIIIIFNDLYAILHINRALKCQYNITTHAHRSLRHNIGTLKGWTKYRNTTHHLYLHIRTLPTLHCIKKIMIKPLSRKRFRHLLCGVFCRRVCAGKED